MEKNFMILETFQENTDINTTHVNSFTTFEMKKGNF